jgi:hypothetical protein
VRQNPGQRIRFPRPAIIAVCVLVVAAATGGVIAWRVTRQPATLPNASCGSVITHRLDADTKVYTDGEALTCFATAARGCKAASIGVTEMGTDTGTGHVFTIEPGGSPCQVTEASQWYSANFGGSAGSVTSMPCRLTAVTGRGVMLDCAGQDVLIAASVSGP